MIRPVRATLPVRAASSSGPRMHTRTDMHRAFTRLVNSREALESKRVKQLWKIAQALDNLAREELEHVRPTASACVDHDDIEVSFKEPSTPPGPATE